MEAFAAGCFQETDKAEIGKKVADFPGGCTQDIEVERLVRIQVEHEAIRFVDCGQRYPPVVDLERADLGQCKQPVCVLDIEIGFLALAAGDRNLLYGGVHALHGMTLKKVLAIETVRATHETNRTRRYVRQNRASDALVELREIALGEVDIRIEDFVRACQCDVAERDLAVCVFGFMGNSQSSRSFSIMGSSRITARAGLSSSKP